jgi:hypothetical protein
MSATATKKRKWLAHRDVSVADQRTERTATAIASDSTWGEKENDYKTRQLEVTIYAEHGVDQDSEVLVKCETTDFAIGEYASENGNIQKREFDIETQLGDLPLLVLALEEAIRIGVKQGAFPEIRGGKKP